jgi:hypothetical protein
MCRIEEKSKSPYIVVFYQLMFPAEMRHFKEFASGTDSMHTAGVNRYVLVGVYCSAHWGGVWGAS